MATIVTRSGKGSPLTNTEVDANFTNLNNDKFETNAQIRAAVEGASDSNVFTDADHTKLNGVAASANNYSHPTYNGDDFSVDTGALTGATVVSDIDINVTTDTQGHVTDANGTVSTRTLTLANLGYTGATNANNYSHPTGNGNNHIPSNGSSGQILGYASAGTAQWQASPSSDLVDDTSPQLGGDLQTNGHDVVMGNNDLIKLGTFSGQAAAGFIFSNGSTLTINSWGATRLTGSNMTFAKAGGGEEYANFVADGATSLYHNNIKKFETTSSGISVTGNATFADNGKAIFGAGSDLQLYHNGSYSVINNSTGSLQLQSDTSIELKNQANSENYLVASANGAVQVFYDNSVKFATTSSGVSVTGNATFADNDKAIFGAGSDLQIYHDGSNSYIKEAGTGDLYIDANFLYLQYGSNTKLATYSGGISVTGNVVVSGTVDGRDVATDGSKLDGVAASANNYSHPTGNGNNHIPANGAASQVLTYASAGTAQWADPAGAKDDIFYENSQTVSSNYTLTTGKNAVSAGPITIASGVTVTVPSGAGWAVV